ncbi:FCS-Like Zinc finger 8-like [Euphorbia lathyris]|uniref:FCS-Like Zinc finger 8-like n=1 Tax=Euphorbia lathyris TaxID=212925 RepID=UPI0033140651
MLLNRSRSRAVSSNSKQALMSDHMSSSQTSSIQNYTKQLPSFRFKPFKFKGMPESETLISPTSILEPFSPKNPFCSNSNHPKFPENKHSWDKLNSKGIGVALLAEDQIKTSTFSKPSNKMVLFATKLKLQIPPLVNFDSPNSPSDFGIKTRNSQFSRSGNQGNFCPQILTGCVSMSELELSEDYACVISYGPNPKTIHIYDNYVLSDKPESSPSPKSFLSFCHTCQKNLEQKNDIFIYRGDEAFCSEGCRYTKMVLDGIES